MDHSKFIASIQKEEFIRSFKSSATETKIFYEDLYASKDSQLVDIDLFELFRNIDTKKLNKDESDSIEGPISYPEAASVLRAMSNNRSPGSDGFSAEFFKIFWKKMGQFIVRSLTMGFLKGNYQSLKGKE